MKIAYIVRSTLFDVRGGDTIQIQKSADALRKLGVVIDIYKANEKIAYHQYDLLHFFNLSRPADILKHIRSSSRPFVLTPIFIDYSAYDRNYRRGFSRWLFRFCSSEQIEYFKTIARFLKGKDAWPGFTYLLIGQKKSMKKILEECSFLLTGTELEYDKLKTLFKNLPVHKKVALAIDAKIFQNKNDRSRDPNLLLCVARIEGIKNQLNLIEAVNDSNYTLWLIGDPAPNQRAYYRECKAKAASNVVFMQHISQEKLVDHYQEAKVHILPSWFENAGLSTLEAAAMGCNVVVSERGFISEYLGNEGYYCDPASPASIREAIDNAAAKSTSLQLQERISTYTWQNVAEEIFSVYNQLLKQ
jgi:glycosyltransferase involved in cell wall biosynthesis